MADESSLQNQDTLVQLARDGNEDALAQLFELYKGRLRRMVDLRLNRLVRGRVNPSDVLQEAFIDLVKELKNHAADSADPQVPMFVRAWRLTGRRLDKIHRTHLGAAMRDASREVSIYRGRMPQATSHALASKLIGNSTSVLSKIEKSECQLKLQEVINTMGEADREILAMRHFEELSNLEVAAVLEVTEHSAAMRHMRALRRLRSALTKYPDWFEHLTLGPPGKQAQPRDAEPKDQP